MGWPILRGKTYRPLPALPCAVGVVGCGGCAGCMESPYSLLGSSRVPMDEDDPSQWGGATWYEPRMFEGYRVSMQGVDESTSFLWYLCLLIIRISPILRYLW